MNVKDVSNIYIYIYTHTQVQGYGHKEPLLCTDTDALGCQSSPFPHSTCIIMRFSFAGHPPTGSPIP